MASIFDVGTNLGLNPNSVGGQLLNANGAFAGGVPGIINAAEGQVPTSSVPTMDAGSQAQVTQNENGLMSSPDQNAAKIMNGTQAGDQIQDQSAARNAEQAESGGSGMPGMNDAIAAKAAKNFAVSKGRLQQNADLQGAQMTNQNVNTATANAIALMNAQNNVNSSLNQLQLQTNAARYQTVAGIMSGAGSFAGGLAAMPNAPQNYGVNSALNASESTFTNPTQGGGYLGNQSNPDYSEYMNSNYNFGGG